MTLASSTMQERELIYREKHTDRRVKLVRFVLMLLLLNAPRPYICIISKELFASEGLLSKFEVMAYFYHFLSLQTHESGTPT